MTVMPTLSAIIRSDVRTVLDHVFDFRTFERACRTIEQGTDIDGVQPDRLMIGLARLLLVVTLRTD
jgi:hypothetical protein